MRAWFVSDVHVSEETGDRGTKLIAFFQGLNSSNTTHLFLVGDIFDLWIGKHDYFVERYSQMIMQLLRLRSQGIEVHYFEGNHDLYLEDFFAKELHCEVHSDPVTLRLGGWTVRIEHGDQIDETDRGYHFLRWLLRTPVVSWLARHLPGWMVAALGRKMSEKSRMYTSTLKTKDVPSTVAMLRKHAETLAAVEPYDFVISGHVHVRDDYSFTVQGRPVRAINLGTWLDQPVALELTEKDAHLKLL